MRPVAPPEAVPVMDPTKAAACLRHLVARLENVGLPGDGKGIPQFAEKALRERRVSRAELTGNAFSLR